MVKSLANFLIILVTIGLIMPIFGLINSPQVAFAKETNQPLELPSTLDEIVAIGKRIIHFPFQIINNAWQEVWRIWVKMFTFAKNIWDNYIFPEIDNLWHRILAIFGREIEKKKETIPQELEKEKKEIQQETPKTSRGF